MLTSFNKVFHGREALFDGDGGGLEGDERGLHDVSHDGTANQSGVVVKTLNKGRHIQTQSARTTKDIIYNTW